MYVCMYMYIYIYICMYMYNLFRSGSILGHFLVAISYFYLSLYLYYYPLLFGLCAHVRGCYNCYIRTLL